MTSKQVDAHDKPVALLRPLSVRRLVALLRSLPARARAAILAKTVHEGTMTRVWADQVLFALALDDNPVTRAALCLVRHSATQAPSLRAVNAARTRPCAGGPSARASRTRARAPSPSGLL